MPLQPRDRLIVALDVSSVEAAQAMVTRLGDAVSFYKIGYQLGFAGGLPFSQALIDAGKQVFVDLKLHDIGNTVAQGVKSVARLGATFLTVHAYPQTMQAAVEAREGQLRILAVTVLTSYDNADLAAAGYGMTVTELVARRAAQARDIGVDGLVCSPEEAANLRAIVGAETGLGDARHPAGRQRGGRAKAHRDAGRRDRGRRRLSGGRPADHRGRRSEGRGGRPSSNRDRKAAKQLKETPHAQGLLDRTRRCAQRRGLQALCGGQSRRSSRNTAAASWSAPANSNRPKASARSRNVVIEFPDYAAALACYRSPEYQANIKLRLPHSIVDMIIIEGYDGPQP